ncbi:uncharacterized protein LOC113374717 [Ctenocephalides felis]|uniref:uncharacterized protein LOC113374717 n=1 Tax=Ctenocephalides felis TaxID=7515 RepID=UPI000E6E1B20|nr:uncharacterized protein LOC113374717 [Ctenocephalides felis]
MLEEPKGALCKDLAKIIVSENKAKNNGAVLGRLKKTIRKGVELGYLKRTQGNRISLCDEFQKYYFLEPEMVLAGRARRAQKNIKRRKSRRSPKRRPKRGSKAPKRRPKRRSKSSQRKGRGRRRGRLSRRAGSIPSKKYHHLTADISTKSRSTSSTTSTTSSRTHSKTPLRTPSGTCAYTPSWTPLLRPSQNAFIKLFERQKYNVDAEKSSSPSLKSFF